ncbi:OmpA family protein [Hyphomicrobium sp. LHD-15]|uniref:OmpA family protein n=1 Tax=Hyphomicrobium sp. LHD-15 TaxID=3072142 RepID=UPI00280D6F6F|nr:OmpA family protein [Hyphomicrobium sp. LHD-15]MDQ8698162.1 OmpA family protein [Hyphomicrobium sp. LHD-15]
MKRGNRDEAEKPFWISFADLMTALMVLFLVSLTSALVQAQKDTERATQAEKQAKEAEASAKNAHKALEAEKQKLAEALAELKRREEERDTRREQRNAEISACHGELERLIADFNDNATGGVRLDRARNVIDFGSRAQFGFNSNELSYEQAQTLRNFTLQFLSVLRRDRDICQSWLKRVVVEGFTDKKGTYLHNLNLSLNRSQRVMCVLLAGEYAAPSRVMPTAQTAQDPFAPSTTGSIRRETSPSLDPLPPDEQTRVEQLFLVGGYSSNSLKATDEESRRIELRIEFYQVDEDKTVTAPVPNLSGRCGIGGR